jgi:uncharacterized protein (TIRG00374 family)
MKVFRASLWLLLVFLLYIFLLWWGDRQYRFFDDITPFLKLIPLVGIISLVTYMIRFARWRALLNWVGCPTPLHQGFLAYLSGFAFTATPGKIGELIRIRYLNPMGVQPKDVISVFILERTQDILVLLLLSLVMVMHGRLLGMALALVMFFFVLVGCLAFCSRPLELIFLGLTRLKMLSFAKAIEHLRYAIKGLGRWSLRQWTISFGLGLLAWSLTAMSFVVVLYKMQIVVPILSAIGIYPLAMLVGAASMLPGGLGSTEGAIVAQLQWQDVDMVLALVAAIVVRLGTLWLAVLVGGLSILTLEWRLYKNSYTKFDQK